MNSEETVSREHLVLETAMEAGHILLENGAEIFRVEETMERICRAFGVEERNFFVLSNGIFTTGGNRLTPYAKVRHIPVHGADMGKVVQVNDLSRRIERGECTLEQAVGELKTIRSGKGKSPLLQIGASAVGAACFCLLFGGSFADSAAAFLAGLLLWVFVLFISAPYLSKIAGNLAGGMLVTALCILCLKLGIGDDLSHTIIGGIIPLIPGIPFTNGIRDIVEGDYLSGVVRLLDASLVFLCIAVGVGITLMLFSRFGGGVPV